MVRTKMLFVFNLLKITQNKITFIVAVNVHESLKIKGKGKTLGNDGRCESMSGMLLRQFLNVQSESRTFSRGKDNGKRSWKRGCHSRNNSAIKRQINCIQPS